MAGQSKRGKGRTRKSGNPNRIRRFINQPPKTQKNKDRNVLRSSHGVFKTVAELEKFKSLSKEERERIRADRRSEEVRVAS